MLGYWDEPDKTAEAIDSARWMHTGDLAVMDEAGYLNIVGRIKDMVIRGGENIYPREVEEFLYGHPAIEDVQVIGVPDLKYGEELCAWIQLRPGQELTPRTRSRSTAAARSRTTRSRATSGSPRDFPMTVTGKVQKFKMRETSIDRARPRSGQPDQDRLTFLPRRAAIRECIVRSRRRGGEACSDISGNKPRAPSWRP